MNPTTAPWIIKFGGSLLGAPTFARWLEALKESRAIVVPGGGPFAETIRVLQPRLGLDEPLAHALAIRAMALTARVLEGLEPGLVGEEAPDDLRARAARGQTALWRPTPEAPFLADVEASWRITSDSLAVELAKTLGLPRVLFIKSVPARPGRESLQTLIDRDILDPAVGTTLGDRAITLFRVGPEQPEGLVRSLKDPVSWLSRIDP